MSVYDYVSSSLVTEGNREGMLVNKVTKVKWVLFKSLVWEEVTNGELKILERRPNWWRKELVKEAGQGVVKNTSGEVTGKAKYWKEGELEDTMFHGLHFLHD